MAATVVINEWTSESVITAKQGGTVRFKNANNAAVDLADPMVVPAAGTVDHSFEKWLRLQITDEGGFTQIDNLQAYSDGENSFTTKVQGPKRDALGIASAAFHTLEREGGADLVAAARANQA